jgi:hypothetical protein
VVVVSVREVVSGSADGGRDVASVNAAYTPPEIEESMGMTTMTEWQPRRISVASTPFPGGRRRLV